MVDLDAAAPIILVVAIAASVVSLVTFVIIALLETRPRPRRKGRP